MKEENDDQNEQQPDQLFDSMIALILENYTPVLSARQLTTFITTQHLFEKMQEVYPNPFYTASTVARAIYQRGFRLTIVGDLEFVWLMRQR